MCMNRIVQALHVLYLLVLIPGHASSQEHPSLTITKEGVVNIQRELGELPLFDVSLEQVKVQVDAEISSGIDVPIPKDYSGGYTHERHKLNYLTMQKAGLLYQVLDDEKYAIYVRDMLMQYADMYPTLSLHPKERSYARGKLFWQCLNDANWLVYTSQAYDCIYEWLSKKQRQDLEINLFRPFADFLSTGNPKFFNRIHNHSTWGNAAVGMIGLVMDDDELVQKALYGLPDDNIEPNAKDNDGGFIKTENGKSGFLANLDEPFSPDGYYTEGPYYQRYAMYPFLIFAQSLHNARPELGIFEFKDSVLLKSVNTLLQLTDKNGDFFALNDAQKGMSYQTSSLVTAVDLSYYYGGKDTSLLHIAEQQGKVILSDAGMEVAKGVNQNTSRPFKRKSMQFSDGANGKQGGLSVLRSKDESLTLVFKYTAQGLSHGHYDKLSYSLYEQGNEVVQDYGMVRYVNIEQKGGGNYLKENNTWAKQTIAHNTLVKDETSHFQGTYEIGSKYHSNLYFFDASNSKVQIISAVESNAYTDTQMHRTMAMIEEETYGKPFVFDILRVNSQKPAKYDLPLHYLGQPIQFGFDYQATATLEPLGTANGYQHIFLEGKGQFRKKSNATFSWMHQNHFYTLTTIVSQNEQFLLGRLGANDPQYNLRRDPVIIHRKEKTKDALFVSIMEPHGSYSPVTEMAKNAKSNIEHIEIIYNNKDYIGVQIKGKNWLDKIFILANTENDKSKKHRLTINGKLYEWVGPYTYQNKK
ncbi:alginate lyase family protein [Muricauda ruestringensis]|uniref:Alginate lyase family protein n=2 Tax=Flavobacteriaceae TaxID=49546 RepID=A0ABS3GBN0_9FLAO|nr:alginate lyase family protein [Allomuricauda aurea]